MSATKPPILSSSGEPRYVDLRRRRRVRVAIGGVCVLAALAAAALVPGGLGSDLGSARKSAPKAPELALAALNPPRSTSGAQGLSTLGLPLGTPALALHGLNAPGRPVEATFRPGPRAGILVDLGSGRVLWEDHPLRRAPIASLTKMMTALLVVQSAPPDARVLITKEAKDTQGSRVGVLPLGREVPLEPMMYGLLLPSGNDVAVALAEHVGGTVRHFVQEMNEEAAVLGLGCTQYSNPSGLIDSGNFSCPADLAVLADDDLAQPRIASVVRTSLAVLPFPIKGGKLFLYNNNPILIYGYPGANGVKTGYTTAAGKCVVATAERDGVRLAVVLLDAPAPGSEAQRLLDDGFQDVYHLPPVREPRIPGGV